LTHEQKEFKKHTITFYSENTVNLISDSQAINNSCR